MALRQADVSSSCCAVLGSGRPGKDRVLRRPGWVPDHLVAWLCLAAPEAPQFSRRISIMLSSTCATGSHLAAFIGRHPFAGIGTPRPRAAAPRVLRLTPRLGARTSGISSGPLRQSIGSASRNDRRISRACCPPIGATAERTSGSARPRKTGSRRGGASRTWWRPRPQSASSASSRCWRRSTLRPSSAGSTG